MWMVVVAYNRNDQTFLYESFEDAEKNIIK